MPGGRARRHTDRPDGSTYHITWSLGPGRKARESNDVLRDQGWELYRRADPRRPGAGALLMAEPRLFLDADGVLADFDEARAGCSGCTPRAVRAQARPRQLLEAAGAGRELLRHAAGNARRPAAVRRRRSISSRRSSPACRSAIGPRRRRSNGRPSIFPACRSSPAWRATSTSTCIPATCWSTTARTTARPMKTAGVIFVHHKNAEDSLRQLAKIFPSVKAPDEAA